MKFGVIRDPWRENTACENSAGCSAWLVARTTPRKKRPSVRGPERTLRLGGKAREIFEASGRTYGSPRVAVVLRRAGETVRPPPGRAAHAPRPGCAPGKSVASGPARRTAATFAPSPPTTWPTERAQPPTRPGEVWQADITYVATREGWLYLAGVLDACSRKIVGWAVDDTMPTGLVARAFERAVASQQPAPGLLHHSDRGSQYASDAYRGVAALATGSVASMSRAANCYDNARMESFWATLKTELIDGQVYATRAEARSAIFWYIEVFYNRARLHGALGLHFTRGL